MSEQLDVRHLQLVIGPGIGDPQGRLISESLRQLDIGFREGPSGVPGDAQEAKKSPRMRTGTTSTARASAGASGSVPAGDTRRGSLARSGVQNAWLLRTTCSSMRSRRGSLGSRRIPGRRSSARMIPPCEFHIAAPFPRTRARTLRTSCSHTAETLRLFASEPASRDSSNWVDGWSRAWCHPERCLPPGPRRSFRSHPP